jgi:hypothetical protein
MSLRLSLLIMVDINVGEPEKFILIFSTFEMLDYNMRIGIRIFWVLQERMSERVDQHKCKLLTTFFKLLQKLCHSI